MAFGKGQTILFSLLFVLIISLFAHLYMVSKCLLVLELLMTGGTVCWQVNHTDTAPILFDNVNKYISVHYGKIIHSQCLLSFFFDPLW